MNTYTVEQITPDDNRTIRHQCVDYINATVAFDASLAEIAETGGAVELVQHVPDGSTKVKGVYRRAVVERNEEGEA